MISDLLQKRHCKRTFLNQPVLKEDIAKVLALAGQSASSKNMQPWQVAVVSGQMLDCLRKRLSDQFDCHHPMAFDYEYHMDPLPDTFKKRASDCGHELYKLKGIDRHDYDKRRQHFRQNFLFFGAPMALFFHLPKGAMFGQFLDMGIFLNAVMLGLVDLGLGSCPQFSVCGYSNTIREVLNLEDNRLLVCGLSVGYPDEQARVNQFVPTRASIHEYVQFYDGEVN